MTDSHQDGPAGLSSGSPAASARCRGDGLLAVAANLSQYHREHEKYYSEAPLTGAISLQRTARTLIALAERWASAEPAGITRIKSELQTIAASSEQTGSWLAAAMEAS